MTDKKDTLYLKKDKTFLQWENNILQYKTERTKWSIDLNELNNIQNPLLSEMREYMTLNCNYSRPSLDSQFRCFKVFNNYLLVNSKNISNLSEIDQELLSGYLLMLKDNPKKLHSCKITSCAQFFGAMRTFYRWANKVGIGGHSFAVLRWLTSLKLPPYEGHVAIKT